MSKVTRTIMLALALGAIAAPVAHADAFRPHDAYGKSDAYRLRDAMRPGDAYGLRDVMRRHGSTWSRASY